MKLIKEKKNLLKIKKNKMNLKKLDNNNYFKENKKFKK